MRYWEFHKRKFISGRLIWYGGNAGNDFWREYWKSRLGPDFYRRAASLDLRRDPLGRIFLDVLSMDGIHLEAGCGPGWWVAALCASGYKVEGIELSEDIVAMANALAPELCIRMGDALAIDRPSGYYDSYISPGVVEHAVEGPESFLMEAHRVLKPEGVLIVSVPAVGPIRFLKGILGLYHMPEEELPFFQYGFTRIEFCRILHTCGFEPVRYEYIYFSRLLAEECIAYRRLSRFRKTRLFRHALDRIFRSIDGHMLVVVAKKVVY